MRTPTVPAAETTDVEPYRKILSERFGFPELRSAQALVLAALEAGDVFAVSPTGSGKSMCYVLPALRRGRVLVVSPHIALMQDQVESLQANGVNAVFINSTLSRDEKRQNYLGFIEGDIDLLYTSPESLANSKFVAGLARHDLNLLAIDEAHCVSEWGHTFRPDYLRLKEVRAALGSPRTLALTATATPLARRDIVQRLGMGDAAQIINSVSRDNLLFSVEQPGSNEQKRDALVQFVMARKGRSGIVYVGSRIKTEELAQLLTDHGVKAQSYHAGLGATQRSTTQRAFMTDEVDVIVATNAFGLGVDKPDIRFVVHFDMPGRLEAYYQEAGRAGRDGEPAECQLLYTRWSRNAPEYFIERDHPTGDEVRGFWHELLSYAADGEDGREAGDLNGRNVDGRVMAIQALQKSQLVDIDGSTLMSRDPAADIRTDTISHHKRYELSMLDRMVEFATTSTCRLEVVLRYFGETVDDACGRCDNCKAPESGRNRRTGNGAARTRSGDRAGPSDEMTTEDPDKTLFETLRAWRTQQAKTQSVPAYVIFSNRVLIELARSKPTDMLRLINVSGVGSVKRDKYGQEVLRLINDHIATSR